MSALCPVWQPPCRAEFPLLAANPELVYLDNAATTQKPECVLNAERYFYTHSNANVHRAPHRLAVAATEAFEAARATVAHFIHAASVDEIVFTRGATEAINLVANSWGAAQLRPGDEILVTELEHHANIVPWQLLAARCGATVIPAPITPQGEIDREALRQRLGPKTRLLALTQTANAIGTKPPVVELITEAHAAGALVLLDGAQAIAHTPIDIQALGADFYVFSGHKIYGPTGIGVLWGRAELLAAMPPWQGGGEMIDQVRFSGTTFAEPPARFEAGTPPIAQAIGLAAALDWLSQQDHAALLQHETTLREMLEMGLKQINGVHVVGNAAHKAPVTALTFDQAHPFDVAQFLDARHIAVRVGHHCAQPLFTALGLEGALRISFACYNTTDEVAYFLTALTESLELLA